MSLISSFVNSYNQDLGLVFHKSPLNQIYANNIFTQNLEKRYEHNLKIFLMLAMLRAVQP